MSQAKPAVTFILGVMQRSGTNFLSDLLRVHPDYRVPEPIWEDHLIRNADVLVDYAKRVSGGWNACWGVEGLDDALMECLGGGICDFLASRVDSGAHRIVTKSPYVRNLRYIQKLFPDQHLLIVVRDGRDVVESGVRSFGWSYEYAMQTWANGAAEILRFDSHMRQSNFKYRIVRYEDLHSDLTSELGSILEFLEVSSDRYDFAAAARLPVRGSSDLRHSDNGKVHWDEIGKDDSFRPIQRWEGWSRALRERFDWVAGDHLAKLGYQPARRSAQSIPWSVWNRSLDAKYGAKMQFKDLRRTLYGS